MIQLMLSRHVTESTKVIIKAVHTLPADASEHKSTAIAHNAMVLDT